MRFALLTAALCLTPMLTQAAQETTPRDVQTAITAGPQAEPQAKSQAKAADPQAASAPSAPDPGGGTEAKPQSRDAQTPVEAAPQPQESKQDQKAEQEQEAKQDQEAEQERQDEKEIEKEQDRAEKDAKPEPYDPSKTVFYSHAQVCKALVEAAREKGLPVAFFARLIWHESQFKPHVVSPVGAIGIAQFMPETARAMDIANPFDALEALPASAELLDVLKRRFGNIGLAAAAYNSTPYRVARWLKGKTSLPEETQRYVRNVTGRSAESWRNAKSHGVLPELPRAVPCMRVDAFVQAERMEREELARAEAIRVAAERAEAERIRFAAAERAKAEKEEKAEKTAKADRIKVAAKAGKTTARAGKAAADKSEMSARRRRPAKTVAEKKQPAKEAGQKKAPVRTGKKNAPRRIAGKTSAKTKTQNGRRSSRSAARRRR